MRTRNKTKEEMFWARSSEVLAEVKFENVLSLFQPRIERYDTTDSPMGGKAFFRPISQAIFEFISVSVFATSPGSGGSHQLSCESSFRHSFLCRRKSRLDPTVKPITSRKVNLPGLKPHSTYGENVFRRIFHSGDQ